jgi:CTP synthase
VTAIKIDPYINVDAGTMSPFEHGEVYVLDDGGETDLDLGNYERFLNLSLTKDNNLTTGKVYQGVIEKERNGEYLGKTVQAIPHLTDYIKEHISNVAHIPVDPTGITPDVCIIELGGTIGDFESMLYLEALAEFTQDLSKKDYCLVLVSLIPELSSGELKTKPTQHAIKPAKTYGLSPDILCLRCTKSVPKALQEKLRKTCHLRTETAIISNHDVKSIYEVPDVFRKQKLDRIILNKLGIVPEEDALSKLENYYNILTQVQNETLDTVTIAIVGKYTGMQDTYLSLIRALEHASFSINRRLVIEWICAEKLENITVAERESILSKSDGILIPGGFGSRGIEGMVLTSQYSRKNNVPFLGICLGLQVLLIDLARNEMKWTGANSTEFDKDTLYPVIRKSKKTETKMGGTMRLGLCPVKLQGKTYEYYKEHCQDTTNGKITHERHRHRYEVKNKLFRRMVGKGIVKLGGESGDNQVVEIVEVAGDSKDVFQFACQFHPEYKSRNSNPHWLFTAFLKSSIESKTKKE